MKVQSGFTLVETLVTGVLSTIVAGTLVSVLNMVNQQINAGVAESRLGRVQTVVSEQIRASVRRSWGILQSGERIDDLDPMHHFNQMKAVNTTQEVIMAYANGRPQAIYAIANDGTLLEWHDGDPGNGDPTDYYPFMIGGEVVHVAQDKSDFSIAEFRKSMTFRLAYVRAKDTLPMIPETIQCRNLSN